MTTEEVADKIWTILVEECGAQDDDLERAGFVCDFENGVIREYRFIGELGFGGKFWNNNNRWYVTCYPEDETRQRARKIYAANKRLAKLRNTFLGVG